MKQGRQQRQQGGERDRLQAIRGDGPCCPRSQRPGRGAVTHEKRDLQQRNGTVTDNSPSRCFAHLQQQQQQQQQRQQQQQQQQHACGLRGAANRLCLHRLPPPDRCSSIFFRFLPCVLKLLPWSFSSSGPPLAQRLQLQGAHTGPLADAAAALALPNSSSSSSNSSSIGSSSKRRMSSVILCCCLVEERGLARREKAWLSPFKSGDEKRPSVYAAAAAVTAIEQQQHHPLERRVLPLKRCVLVYRRQLLSCVVSAILRLSRMEANLRADCWSMSSNSSVKSSSSSRNSSSSSSGVCGLCSCSSATRRRSVTPLRSGGLGGVRPSTRQQAKCEQPANTRSAAAAAFAAAAAAAAAFAAAAAVFAAAAPGSQRIAALFGCLVRSFRSSPQTLRSFVSCLSFFLFLSVPLSVSLLFSLPLCLSSSLSALMLCCLPVSSVGWPCLSCLRWIHLPLYSSVEVLSASDSSSGDEGPSAPAGPPRLRHRYAPRGRPINPSKPQKTVESEKESAGAAEETASAAETEAAAAASERDRGRRKKKAAKHQEKGACLNEEVAVEEEQRTKLRRHKKHKKRSRDEELHAGACSDASTAAAGEETVGAGLRREKRKLKAQTPQRDDDADTSLLQQQQQNQQLLLQQQEQQEEQRQEKKRKNKRHKLAVSTHVIS
ncbi:hypothetical protein Esti_004513 [Eimeria stiedai]